MTRKIRITIGRDGKSTVQPEGYVGPGCLAITQPFEKVLGLVEERQLTEAYEQTVTETLAQQVEETL